MVDIDHLIKVIESRNFIMRCGLVVCSMDGMGCHKQMKKPDKPSTWTRARGADAISVKPGPDPEWEDVARAVIARAVQDNLSTALFKFLEYLPGAGFTSSLAILLVAPLLGSFITEPAAMIICALLLGRRLFELDHRHRCEPDQLQTCVATLLVRLRCRR